jgi:phage replication O-like protein O
MKIKASTCPVPNVIFDTLMKDLSGAEFKILSTIIRNTIGWHKEKEAISIQEFCDFTGLSSRHITNGCNSLVEKGIIEAIKRDGKTTIFSFTPPSKNAEVNPLTKMTGVEEKKCKGTPPQKCEALPIYKDNIKDTIKNSGFKPPKIDDIEAYINEHNLSVNSETFFYHYESKGWKIGKNSMKDWKASLRYWNSTNKKTNKADDVVERFFI